MIERPDHVSRPKPLLRDHPADVILGARQVGKPPLAGKLARTHNEALDPRASS
jgi:hypothetical protein